MLFWFLLHLSFLEKMCTSAPYRITVKTQKHSQVYLFFFVKLYMFFKYISENYIKSKQKIYFPIFSLEEVY